MAFTVKIKLDQHGLGSFVLRLNIVKANYLIEIDFILVVYVIYIYNTL